MATPLHSLTRGEEEKGEDSPHGKGNNHYLLAEGEVEPAHEEGVEGVGQEGKKKRLAGKHHRKRCRQANVGCDYVVADNIVGNGFEVLVGVKFEGRLIHEATDRFACYAET